MAKPTELLDCAMCDASDSFVISPIDPSIGYCFAEQTAWRVSDKRNLPIVKQEVGTTGGFHYGTSEWPCNGVLHATDREHTDGRQIFVCDACGRECVKTRVREESYSTNLKGDL